MLVASTTISPNIEQEATYAMGHNKIVLKSLLPHNFDVAKNRHIGFLRNVWLEDFVEKSIFLGMMMSLAFEMAGLLDTAKKKCCTFINPFNYP